VNGLGNKVLQIMWTGAKYAVTDELDVIGAYYHYIQNSYFGTPAGGPLFCSTSEHPQCAGTYDAISAAVDWRFAPKWDLYFGMMFNQVHGGLGSGFFQHSNIDPTVGVRFKF
jgi:predicted porin